MTLQQYEELLRFRDKFDIMFPDDLEPSYRECSGHLEEATNLSLETSRDILQLFKDAPEVRAATGRLRIEYRLGEDVLAKDFSDHLDRVGDFFRMFVHHF